MTKLHYRNRVTKTVYLTVSDVTHGLCKVTTAHTPSPYVVNAENVETFEPKLEKKLILPIPKAKNKGLQFFRWDRWVTVGKWDPEILERTIHEHKRDLYKFKNADALQVEVDYIAALQYRLEHPNE